MSGGAVRVRPSLICDRLPNTITLNGEAYRINTDFRRWILLTELSETGIDVYAAADCMSMLVCPAARSVIRNDRRLAAEFIREIGWFALCGEDLCEKRESRSGRSGGMPIFDFEADSERIFASFMAVYGIDLTAADMHWWKFMALLRNLPRDCAFMQVVDLRSVDVTKIADDGLRKQLRRARAAVRLPRRDGVEREFVQR